MITEIVECACVVFRSVGIVGAHQSEEVDVYPMAGFLFLAELARIGITLGPLVDSIREGRAFERADLGASLIIYMTAGAILGFLAAKYEIGLPPPKDDI